MNYSIAMQQHGRGIIFMSLGMLQAQTGKSTNHQWINRLEKIT